MVNVWCGVCVCVCVVCGEWGVCVWGVLCVVSVVCVCVWCVASINSEPIIMIMYSTYVVD